AARVECGGTRNSDLRHEIDADAERRHRACCHDGDRCRRRDAVLVRRQVAGEQQGAGEADGPRDDARRERPGGAPHSALPQRRSRDRGHGDRLMPEVRTVKNPPSEDRNANTPPLDADTAPRLAPLRAMTYRMFGSMSATT